jgi:hypothetical protein
VIFAKLDVCFYRHTRFVRAGLEAAGLWAAALTFLRENDSTDGRIAEDELWRLFAVGEKRGRHLADRLVEVGLFEPADGGYVLCRYAAKNETRDEIEARRAATRERVAKHRRGKAAPAADTAVTDHDHDGNTVTLPRQVALHPTVTPRLVPGSDSGSVSDLPKRAEQLVTVASPADERANGAWAVPEGVWRLEQPAWVEAYKGAVAGTLAELSLRDAGAPWVFPREQFKVLLDVVEAHCAGPDRRDLSAWIGCTVADFVRSVVALNEDAKYWSEYGPDGLRKWFNKDRPGLAVDAPADEHPSGTQAVLEPPPMSPAATAEAAKAALAAFGRGGKRG